MECSLRNGTVYETTPQASVVVPSQASHVENLAEKFTPSRPLEDISVDGDTNKKSSGNDVSIASVLASLSQLSITNQELNLSANSMLAVPGFCWPNVHPDDHITSFNQSAYQNFSLLGNSGIASSLGLEQLQQPASQWSASAALGYTLPPGGNPRVYPGWGSASQLTLSMLGRNGFGTRGSVNHGRSMSVQNVNLSLEPQSGRAAGYTSGISLAPLLSKQCSDRLIPEGNRSDRVVDTTRIPLAVGLNQDQNTALDSQWLDLIRVAATKDSPKGVCQQDPQNHGHVPVGLFENSLVPGETYLLDHFAARKLCFPGKAGLGSQPALNRMESYSRKVFVGGLPPDIDEDEIMAAFRHLGPLVVDWPHKSESKSYFPPKDELSVQALVDACFVEDGKLYWRVSSPTMKDKPVQIRPWNLSDADYAMDSTQPLDPRKTVFVGGVPRPLRAVELAIIMARLYGGVCYAGIDTDPELKYPKGAGRVSFSSQQSYIAAISARFVQLQLGDIDKRVEVKPYVLDDQICDECQGLHSAGKFAPFFCANVMCLQYYCEHCWSLIHSSPNREFHKPLVKEGADRPRALPFRWC